MSKIQPVLLLSLVLTACAGSSDYMKESADRPTEPPPGMALVYFLRPTGFVGVAIDFQVWDGDQCIGVSLAHKCFAYPCTPGRHFFMFISENNVAIDAQLSAGKTYYIVANPKMGGWKARVAAHPVTADSEYWEDAPTWAQELDYEEPRTDLLATWQVGKQEAARKIRAQLQSPEGQEYVKPLPSSAGR